MSYIAAHINWSQWQGDGGEIRRRVAKNRHRQSRSHTQGLGPPEQGVHRDEIRRIELQRSRDDRWLRINNHQRTLRQEDQILGYEER